MNLQQLHSSVHCLSTPALAMEQLPSARCSATLDEAAQLLGDAQVLLLFTGRRRPERHGGDVGKTLIEDEKEWWALADLAGVNRRKALDNSDAIENESTQKLMDPHMERVQGRTNPWVLRDRSGCFHGAFVDS